MAKENCSSTTAMAIGLDVGDRKIDLCVVDATGTVVERSVLMNSPEAVKSRFEGAKRVRIAFEAGTHALWMSELLKDLGHEVIVANPRKLAALTQNIRKSDPVDAEYLARMARTDVTLLSPIEPRSLDVQQDMAVIRSRDQLVQVRTGLITHVRSAVKTMGGRIPKGHYPDSFAKGAETGVPEALKPALRQILEVIQDLTRKIHEYDRWIKEAAKKYPQAERLQEVHGVGPLTSLAFVLTVSEPGRFAESRDVGAYFGLVPKRSQSGAKDPELSITKAGNGYMRRLLVSSAHQILGPFGQDSDLRRFGKRLEKKGDKVAKKKAVVAVARKLAVVLHRVWVSGENYDPFWGSRKAKEPRVESPSSSAAPARSAG